MKSSSLVARITIAFIMLLLAANTRAVTGPGAVATNGFPWVTFLSFGAEGSGFIGTGSYITNGVVLTAAHNINTADLVTPVNVTNSIGQSYERATIGGQIYFALGVQNPLYANAAGDPNDMGLFLVLNQPAVPGGVFPVLATTNDAPLTTGNTVEVLGFGQSPPGGLPIYGRMIMTNPVVNVTANTYTFYRPPSSELTDAGDSGGPYIFNYGGTNKIVATHSIGITDIPSNTKTGAAGVRVDTHLDFATGNGQGGSAALVRLAGAGNTTWSTAASWLRSATNFNAVPQANDVAILDPTTGSDAATVVDVNVDTANLIGLLNDVTLNANGKALNVTGASGVLNGGKINVGGAAGSILRVSAGFDNQGSVTISQNGFGYIGSGLPGGFTTFNVALLNGSNASVFVTAGGSLGVTNVNRRTTVLNTDASSLVSLAGGPVGAATMTADRIDNYGMVEVKERSFLDLNNLIWNEVPGQFLLSGGASGDGTGDVFQVINWGTVKISTGGVLVADAVVDNFGSISIAGGTLLTTNFNLSFVTNFPADLAASSLVSTTGRVTIASGHIAVTNAAAGASLRINTGTFTANGGFVDVDRLFVTNSNGSFLFNGGVVTSRFTSVANGRDFYVGSNAVPATLALVDSTHTFSNGLAIAVTGDSTGSVFFSANQLFVTNGTTSVGQAGVGQLSISNGTARLSTVLVGVTNGSQGSLFIAGGTNIQTGPLRVGDLAGASGAVWMAAGQLVVTNSTLSLGNAGTGQMTMSNGLALLNTVLVGVTNGAQGLLYMAGGTNIQTGPLRLGDLAGAIGAVWVTGGQLVVTNAAVTIGNAGTGQMTVSNNGAVLAGAVIGPTPVALGGTNGAQGTLTIAGGTFTSIGTLRAGDQKGANGAVWVTGGQLVMTNTFNFIGNNGMGQMAVSNGTVHSGGLVVGSGTGSQGSLTVAGGTVTTEGFFPSLTAGDQAGATGAVLVTGGSLAVTNGSTIIGNFGVGRLTISNVTVRTRDVTISSKLGSVGTLTLNNGTLAASAGLFNGTNGFINGKGTVDGLITSAGTIAPGFSAGKIFGTTNLTLQSTSILLMELGGTGDLDYDQINLGGNLSADGTLDVTLINAFVPSFGDVFDIFDFASASGEFSITNLPALNPGLSWDTSNLMTVGELHIIPEPSTLGLALLGCAVAMVMMRKRGSRKG